MRKTDCSIELGPRRSSGRGTACTAPELCGFFTAAWRFNGPPMLETLLPRRASWTHRGKTSERLTVDDDNLPDSDNPAGPGHPGPGKAVLAINGMIAGGWPARMPVRVGSGGRVPFGDVKVWSTC
jgi:hypothetical protein